MSVKPESFKPFVPASKTIPELSLVTLLVGAFLGIAFGASSLYLALKVGMTVSASIPIAVLSVTLFRAFSKLTGARNATILENNIVQTTGSSGESIAFGVSATMPALMILGFELELSRVVLVSVLGGLLGIVMMIPLRRALVDESHGVLPYPEGTACAQVLIVGEKGGSSAKYVLSGFGIGFLFKVGNAGMRLFSEAIAYPLSFFKGASLATEVSPELVGVGAIIGLRNAALMVAGGILSSFVLTPAIVLFGSKATLPLFPSIKPIIEMNDGDIWKSYVLYIGAGAVAASGILNLFQNLPTLIRAAKSGLSNVKASRGAKAGKTTIRTQRDLKPQWVYGGMIGLVLAIWSIPQLHMNAVGAIMIVAFGFLFVTVSARITGEIGSSSNPISGMTVATLLLTSLIFLSLGWTSPMERLIALTIAGIVCIAASNGGTTAQDLKTGYLIGATPRNQQIGILVGALTSALVIGGTLKLLNDASTVYSEKELPQITYSQTSELKNKETLPGSMGEKDTGAYHVLHLTADKAVGELEGVPLGKYLLDDAGRFKYLVDPGINGIRTHRDDGTAVTKYNAPKARLMALIIDGILTQKLPWTLILIGASLVLVLELCGIPSLAFAVGVYLPLSSSMPIFLGGVLRWVATWFAKRKKGVPPLTQEEEDGSPGILASSGLIAGGSLAGIALALFTMSEKLSSGIQVGNYFPAFSESPWTALVVLVALCAWLARTFTKRA